MVDSKDDSSKVWRQRLRRALLSELTSQELRAGHGPVEARLLAERRLAGAVFEAKHGEPPGPDAWPEDAREQLSDPDEDAAEDAADARRGSVIPGATAGAADEPEEPNEPEEPEERA